MSSVRDELQALARAVALDRRLEVVTGPPGCGWSLQPARGRIQCDPSDLATEHPDEVRGLVCHEAAHAAVTRYPWLVPADLLAAPGMAVLLNALEDCRIEEWLARRYPGAAPWIDRYNRRLFPEGSTALAGRARVHQYALASVHDWWHGSLPEGLDREVIDALQATVDARSAVVGAQPPLAPSVSGDDGYAASEVARCFVAADRRVPPDGFERRVRMAAHQAWAVVHREILPVITPLIRHDVQVRKAFDAEEEALLRRLSGRPVPSVVRPTRRPSAMTQQGSGDGGHAAASLPALAAHEREALQQAVRPAPADDYEEAQRDVGSLVRPLADELLAALRLDAVPRWIAGHRSGTRLDLMAAMQGQADPRRRHVVWQRKTLPRAHDPCFLLLVDLSGSMEGRAVREALRGTVLMCEVLHLLQVPFAVAGFQDALFWLKPFDQSLDRASRGRVASMIAEVRGQHPGGHNRPEHNWDGPVLLEAARALVERPERQRVLVVVSDGQPSGPNDGDAMLLRAVAAVQDDQRVELVGLGLGPGTEHVARYYAQHAAAVPLPAFPATLGRILRSSLRTSP